MVEVAKIKLEQFSEDGRVECPLFVVWARQLRDLVYERDAYEGGLNWDGYFRYRDDHFFAFDEANLRIVLEKFDLVVIERAGHNKENVERVTLTRARNISSHALRCTGPLERFLPVQFEAPSFEGSEKNSFLYMVGRALAVQLGRKVLLSVPHGEHKEYSSRGGFQLNIWSSSSPDGELSATAPRAIFGTEVSCRGEAYKANQPYVDETDAGIFLMEKRYVVAELLPNALYIHHDLVHDGAASEFRLMMKIINEALKYLLNPKELKKQAILARKDYDVAQAKFFQNLVEQSIPRRMQRNERAIEAAEENAARLLREYFAAEREAFSLRNAAIATARVAKRFTEEFLKLKSGSVAGVQTVNITTTQSNTMINVFTDAITVQHPNTKDIHRLGHFKIVFDLTDGELRFFNLEGPPVGTDHHAPHVDSEGYPCLGNIESEIAGYIANFEIEASITLAIAYLQSVDISDPWGATIVHFPIISN